MSEREVEEMLLALDGPDAELVDEEELRDMMQYDEIVRRFGRDDE